MNAIAKDVPAPNVDDCPIALRGTGFFQLPPETLPPLWPKLRPFAMSAIERSNGMWDEHAVVKFLVNFEWQCWVMIDAGEVIAMVISRIETYPSGTKVLMVETATGESREKWQRLAIDKLQEFGRGEGCGLIRLIARPGWERVFRDFARSHVILDKAL